MAGEIFISYRRSDERHAKLLYDLLKERGVEAWYDRHMAAGDDWRSATANALVKAPIFVLLFSKNAGQSDDIIKELSAATFQKKTVIPVRIEDVHPEGAFLYELASRNWFDAFTNTEAQLVVLADQLVALVKGGAEAQVAATKLGAQPPAVTESKRGRGALTGSSNRRMIFGVGALVLGAFVVVMGGLIALNPPKKPDRDAASAQSQLIAFFEFTPTDDDPVVKATADAATDRMFQAIRANLLGAVARTETRNTPEDMRFARAAELGARYALSGEVRPDANGITLAVRFEDVSSRLTLWEKSFSNPAPDVGYLPAQAALQAAGAMWCIIKTRSELTRDTDEILNLIADRCRDGGGASPATVSYMAARMRAIAQADPASTFNQAQLAMMLGLGVATAPASVKEAWIAEAEAAVQHAAQLDPGEAGVYLARINIAEAKRVPMAEWDAIILEALQKSEGKDSFVFGQSNAFRFQLFRATGRFREAQTHVVAAVANDPLTVPWSGGGNLAVLGERAEARDEFEPALAAYGPWVWDPLISYAIHFDVADADAMLKSPPSTIPKATVDCMRGIRSALAAGSASARALGAKRARVCGDAGSLGAIHVLASLTALGDLDAAFELAGKQAFNQPSLWNGALQVLFWPRLRAMRSDPRFLPLVEKLGLMDYWRATKSQPDLCETSAERDIPLCAALRTAP